jgi:hypothetical protein
MLTAWLILADKRIESLLNGILHGEHNAATGTIAAELKLLNSGYRGASDGCPKQSKHARASAFLRPKVPTAGIRL